MSVEHNCPDCRVPMEEGYLPDRAYRNEVIRWFAGKPPEGLGGFQWTGPTGIPLATFRCPECGLLRSFAVKSIES